MPGPVSVVAISAAVADGLAWTLVQVAGGDAAVGADPIEEVHDTMGADEVGGALALFVRGCDEGETVGPRAGEEEHDLAERDAAVAEVGEEAC